MKKEKFTLVVEYESSGESVKEKTKIHSITMYTPAQTTAYDINSVGTVLLKVGADLLCSALGGAVSLLECKCPNCKETVSRALKEASFRLQAELERKHSDESFYRQISRTYSHEDT